MMEKMEPEKGGHREGDDEERKSWGSVASVAPFPHDIEIIDLKTTKSYFQTVCFVLALEL